MTRSDKITKAQLLRGLLEQEGGASLEEICSATSWQAHSARAALTAIRKSGTVVERLAGKQGEHCRWQIMAVATTATSGIDADVMPIDNETAADKTMERAGDRSAAGAVV